MKKIAAFCLLGCLALPLYFGLKRIPFNLRLESYNTYMTKHYGFEGWPMHQYVYTHIPKHSRIWYVGIIPEAPQFYWQDYDVFPMTVNRRYDYAILVKQNMKQRSDGSWINTYLPKLKLTFPAFENKIWETDRAILYGVGTGVAGGFAGAKVPPPNE